MGRKCAGPSPPRPLRQRGRPGPAERLRTHPQWALSSARAGRRGRRNPETWHEDDADPEKRCPWYRERTGLGTMTEESTVDELSESACWALLRTTSVGRLAVWVE